MQVIADIIAIAFWLGILFGPPAFLFVPRLRRLWTAPLGRYRKARRDRRVTMAQARRDARTEVLEADLARVDSILEKYGA